MGTNLSSPEGLANNPEHLARLQRNETPFRLLTVRVMRARNIHKADTLTESDCYVTLWLPTASSEIARTKTIPNCKDPVWNHAFCYRIDSRVKNIIQMKIWDEDYITKDDELFSLCFDVAKLRIEQTSRVSFKLDPQTNEELDVEFTLQTIPHRPENIITNGTLVSREISCLEVQVDIGKLKQEYTQGDLILTIKGSYEETQKISMAPDSSLSNRNSIEFHCIKNNQSCLEVILPKKTLWSKLTSCTERARSNASVTLPLTELPIHEKISIGEDKTFDLHVKARDWQRGLDVRLSSDLCVEEQNFLSKRRKYVAAAVKKVLQLNAELQDDEVGLSSERGGNHIILPLLLLFVGSLLLAVPVPQVPVVAIMTTGGGTRSFTAMYGSLLGLQKLNLLDCITYITGLSGTTWTMAKLYEDADWSQKYLEEPINEARKQVTKSKFSCFSKDRLKYYYNELEQRTKEGYNTSFIDLWGLVIESMIHDKKDNHILSDQQAAVTEGQNPFPIYLGINLKSNYSAQDFREWLEFTPYEVGSFKYGAFIRSEDFGSEYFMGRRMKKLPESRICFMQGTWSSIFSFDFMFFWNMANSSEDFWHNWTRDRIQDIDDSLLPSPLDIKTHLVVPQGQLSSTLRDVLTGRPTMAEYPNFLKGFQLHDDYLGNSVLDSQPNRLMETVETALSVVDSGFFINTSFPPLLRPQRKVDIILHLNYSGGSQTWNLDQFAAYVSELEIPFPKTELSEEDRKNLKECYVFEDQDDVAAPIVLFFPLTNDTFKKYKAPGVERSPADMEGGNIDVSGYFSPFSTSQIAFSEENFDRLVKMTDYNILNNKDKILEAMRAVVERKKQQKSQSLGCTF
ncbi:cytosolic phospholipase A2 epsilon-like isoform X2 [Hemicordylus capensis]|uniref:cytosolic phospholipase A2 epsilon-like isoform X2 n=1 Tax=Hemicordylus capensis TaxID=884348 RepID=UPI0023021535|nr:cytosolic phospholipase A2 epsilon-like isoform X2 [Hemicordylus capensis]